MNVEVEDISGDHQTITLQSLILYSDFRIGEEPEEADFKRLIKKLVRCRSIILNMITVRFKAVIPIFLYNEIRTSIPCHWNNNIYLSNSDVTTFEVSSSFNESEEASLLSIFKKLKNITKDMDSEKIKYFLPMSSHITIFMFLNFYQVYDFLNILEYSRSEKVIEFNSILKQALNEKDSILFNDTILEIYKTAKEKK